MVLFLFPFFKVDVVIVVVVVFCVIVAWIGRTDSFFPVWTDSSVPSTVGGGCGSVAAVTSGGASSMSFLCWIPFCWSGPVSSSSSSSSSSDVDVRVVVLTAIEEEEEVVVVVRREIVV